MKTLNKLAWIVIAGSVALLLYVLYSLFYPFKVIEILQHPLPVLKHTVRRGEELTYVFKYCKYYAIKPTVIRGLADGVVLLLPPVPGGSLPLGCHTATPSLRIPTTILPGNYAITFTARYTVNLLRTIEYHFTTEKFQVIE